MQKLIETQEVFFRETKYDLRLLRYVKNFSKRFKLSQNPQELKSWVLKNHEKAVEFVGIFISEIIQKNEHLSSISNLCREYTSALKRVGILLSLSDQEILKTKYEEWKLKKVPKVSRKEKTRQMNLFEFNYEKTMMTSFDLGIAKNIILQEDGNRTTATMQEFKAFKLQNNLGLYAMFLKGKAFIPTAIASGIRSGHFLLAPQNKFFIIEGYFGFFIKFTNKKNGGQLKNNSDAFECVQRIFGNKDLRVCPLIHFSAYLVFLIEILHHNPTRPFTFGKQYDNDINSLEPVRKSMVASIEMILSFHNLYLGSKKLHLFRGISTNRLIKKGVQKPERKQHLCWLLDSEDKHYLIQEELAKKAETPQIIGGFERGQSNPLENLCEMVPATLLVQRDSFIKFCYKVFFCGLALEVYDTFFIGHFDHFTTRKDFLSFKKIARARYASLITQKDALDKDELLRQLINARTELKLLKEKGQKSTSKITKESLEQEIKTFVALNANSNNFPEMCSTFDLKKKVESFHTDDSMPFPLRQGFGKTFQAIVLLSIAFKKHGLEKLSREKKNRSWISYTLKERRTSRFFSEINTRSWLHIKDDL